MPRELQWTEFNHVMKKYVITKGCLGEGAQETRHTKKTLKFNRPQNSLVTKSVYWVTRWLSGWEAVLATCGSTPRYCRVISEIGDCSLDGKLSQGCDSGQLLHLY